jgi:hypothetical protein
VALDFVGDGGVIIDAVAGIQDIFMGAQDGLHLSLQNKDEFFPIVAG